jgi:hypothetical protein
MPRSLYADCPRMPTPHARAAEVWPRPLCALLLMAAVVCAVPSLATGTPVLGAVGHPGLQRPDEARALWGSPEAQLATLEERGLRTYRFDVVLDKDHPDALADLQHMEELARSHHVTLHPLLKVPLTFGDATDGGHYPSTPEGLERQGYERVYPVVSKLAHEIHDWELENELDLRPEFKVGGRAAPGLSPSDYQTDTALQWAAVLRGMARAIADVRAQTHEPLRTVVDFASWDFGFIPFLDSQRVKIDVAAYHYYYGLGASPYKLRMKNGTVIDLFAQLAR